jgi:hypothetical protein
MAGLVPAIHVFKPALFLKTWMPGIKPGMTVTSFSYTALTIQDGWIPTAGFF